MFLAKVAHLLVHHGNCQVFQPEEGEPEAKDVAELENEEDPVFVFAIKWTVLKKNKKFNGWRGKVKWWHLSSLSNLGGCIQSLVNCNTFAPRKIETQIYITDIEQ